MNYVRDALLNGVISHNFKLLSKIFSDTAWRGIYATAELFILIEFHMAHDGSNLSGSWQWHAMPLNESVVGLLPLI